jgi:hypothetical protein
MTLCQHIDRLIALNRLGDRAGVDRYLRQLKPRPKALTFRAEQVPLAFMLDCRFRCDRLDGTFRVRECLERRGAVWPSGKRKGAPKSPQCQGCRVGEAFAACFPGLELRPPSQAPEMLRGRRALTIVMDEAPHGYCPMAEAATLTPDDRDEWRA